MIKDAINRRYDLIHYIYTTFEQTTHDAQPILRSMWHDFPDIEDLHSVQTQFMLGSSILVAPKLIKPDQFLSEMKRQRVKYILPEGEVWYNFYTKQNRETVGQWHTTLLSDLAQAVFVRGGTILPILHHENCMSILKCINDPIRLEVYLDENGEAEGKLYVDDGETYKFQNKNEYALIKFKYHGNKLTSAHSDERKPGSFEFSATQIVEEVAIYGLKLFSEEGA